MSNNNLQYIAVVSGSYVMGVTLNHSESLDIMANGARLGYNKLRRFNTTAKNYFAFSGCRNLKCVSDIVDGKTVYLLVSDEN